MKYTLLLFTLLLGGFSFSQTEHKITGVITDENGLGIASVYINIEGTGLSTSSNEEGNYEIDNVPKGKYKVVFNSDNHLLLTRKVYIESHQKEYKLSVSLTPFFQALSEVEVFGDKKIAQRGLDNLTRMPLKPSDQIQSISIISDKMIEEQGALTLTEAVQNIPGVILFGSYGGVVESMSTRGYRGVPVLKNGVRVDSDFRTAAIASDMQGVESVQVLKGSAALTQGIGTGLGSPGGAINVVTKTPRFKNSGTVAIRTGSWGQFRPTFDVEQVLDKDKTVSFRLNGAYERKDSYKAKVQSDRVYVNPSFEWRPDNKTRITLEMDYLNANVTPDRGTVNLAEINQYALVNMPHDRFLGYDTDNANKKITTYAAKIVRQLTDKLSLRAAYIAADSETDQVGATLSPIKNKELNIRSRGLAKSMKSDKNSTLQIDLIGENFYTGPFKHTFQTGFDYQTTKTAATSFQLLKKVGTTITEISVIDEIDVLGSINNSLPTDATYSFKEGTTTKTSSTSYGLMAQDMMEINKYIKTYLGIRYSESNSPEDTGNVRENAWNPMFGVMISPIKNVNIFGSYTNTTDLRSATNLMEGGGTIGPSRSNQWEFGIKSDWLQERLRFNFTYFNIGVTNMSYATYDENQKPTTFYAKAGDLKRSGIETELSGRILPNLQVMLGYSYLDAKYESSPAFVNGSAPMNAPNHTANGWVNYAFEQGVLKNLSLGLGIYYVGKRPVNEYSLKPDNHGTPVGVKPFYMRDYTTVNAQVAYTYEKITTRVYFNNIFNALGYNSYYRGGYINQIDPTNIGVTIAYKF